MKYCCILTLFSCIVNYTFAQKKSLFKRINLDTLVSRNLRFVPLPSISFSPETGLKAGAFVDYFYKTKADSGNIVRPSLSWLQALYSTRKQFTTEAYTSTYTSNEKFYIFFRGGFISNYERFWGFTKPTISNKEYAEVNYNRLYAQAKLQRNIGNKFFAGISLYFSNYSQIKFKEKNTGNNIVPTTANNDSRITGVGFTLTADRRDNQFSPTRGIFTDVTVMANYNLLNNNYAYTLLTTDLRKYNEYGRHIFAHQLLFSLSTNEMPVFEKVKIGGYSIMRGFFQGRFRDNNLWSLQTEYRYGLSRFMKLAMFASTSNTSPTINTLLSQQVQASCGTGLRILINKDKNIYLRCDLAIASNGMLGYYLRMGDAF